MRPPLKKYIHKTVRAMKKSFLWLCRPPRLKGKVLKFRVKIKSTRKKPKK